MSFWKGRRVCVLGGSGFIGSHLVEELAKHDALVTATATSHWSRRRLFPHCDTSIRWRVGDLREPYYTAGIMRGQEVVFYLASRARGAAYNVAHPGSLFRDNLQPFLSVIEAVREVEPRARLVVTSSACVYRSDVPAPASEEEGFVGIPEETNRGYGWAKRMAEFLGEAYSTEFGLDVCIVRPFNVYGPRDNFDPGTANVIPALISRIFSGERPLTVWGDGTATKTFLYVSDLVRGLMATAERSPQTGAINIGSNEEISIKDLAELLVRLSCRKLDIRFDTSKPLGQRRRACDIALARKVLGFEPEVSIEDGLKRTIDWYLRKRESEQTILHRGWEP